MKNPIILLLLIAFSFFHSYAQNEHIFLNTDKSICYAGDTLWFRGFIVNDKPNYKSSTNLYVELYDVNNHLIERKLFPIIEDISYGQLQMPILTGNYWIRAFTLQAATEGIQSITVRPDSAVGFTYRTFKPTSLAEKIPFNITFENDSCIILVPDSIHFNYAISVTHMAYKKTTSLLSIPVSKGFAFHFDTSYINIKAKISQRLHQKMPEIVTIFTKDSITSPPQLFQPDSTGRININNLFFFDSAAIQYRVNLQKNTNKPNMSFEQVREELPTFSPPNVSLYLTDSIPRDAPFSQELENIIKDKKIRNLKPVIIKAKWNDRNLALNKNYVRSKEFEAIEQFSFDLRNPINTGGTYTVMDYLQRELPQGWARYYLPIPECWRGIDIYIDEKKVDPEFAKRRPLSEFAYAKAYQSLHPPCACLVLYTRKGEDLRSLPSSMNTLPISGYSRSLTWTTPDLITYHWNPFVTSSTYKFKIPAKAFRIAIVGNTADGEPIQFSKVVQVP